MLPSCQGRRGGCASLQILTTSCPIYLAGSTCIGPAALPTISVPTGKDGPSGPLFCPYLINTCATSRDKATGSIPTFSAPPPTFSAASQLAPIPTSQKLLSTPSPPSQQLLCCPVVPQGLQRGGLVYACRYPLATLTAEALDQQSTGLRPGRGGQGAKG